MQRTIRIKNDKLHKVLSQKDVVLKGAREDLELQKEVEERLRIQGLELNKFKEKLMEVGEPIIKEIEMGEFEEVSTMEIEGDEIEVTIIDKVEMYKDRLRQEKYLKEKQEEKK